MIRRAEERDIPAVIRIWREGIAGAIGRPAWDLDHLEDFFLERLPSASPPFGFWVACNYIDDVIGWQSLLPFDNNPATRSYFAEASTYVAKESARNGVGESLIRHAMDFAGSVSLQYILGFISASNHGAQAMVMKCGWTRIGGIPGTSKSPATPEISAFAFTLAGCQETSPPEERSRAFTTTFSD